MQMNFRNMKIFQLSIIAIISLFVLISSLMLIPVIEVPDRHYTICENKNCVNATQYGSASYVYACFGVVYDTIRGYEWTECVYNNPPARIK